MEPLPQLWSCDDHDNDLCRLDQIGTPRPERAVIQSSSTSTEDITALEEVLDKDDSALPKYVRRAAGVALRRLGGVKYLMKNEDLLKRILVKAAGEDKHLKVQVTNTVILPSWAGPERLAYKQNIIDAADAFEANKRITQELKD